MRSQARSHTYDALSRVTGAQTPESNNLWTYFYYTTSGGALCSGDPSAVCRRTDARGITTTYAYDSLNRLTSKSWSDSTPAVSYYYDSGPNYYQTNGAGRLVEVCWNAYTSCEGFGYDSMGRVWEHDRAIDMVWNAEGRQTAATTQGVGTTTYTYDGDGRRVKKSTGTLYWYAPWGDVLSETDTAGNMQFEYVYYLGRRIVKVTPGVDGTAYLYFSDGIGSARVITNVNGGICEDSDYLPFGQEIAYTNTCPQNYKFTGMERDAETGNDHTLYRQYAWNYGRWLTPDPLLNSGRPGSPQTWNRYAYVRNNPLNLVDPLGLYDIGNNCDQYDTQCKKRLEDNAKRLREALEKLVKNVDKEKDPVKKARLKAALGAMGSEGDHNGVTVYFGATKGGGAAETDPVYNEQTGKMNYNVTLDPTQISGTNDMAIDAAHEGTHVADLSNPLYNNTATSLSDFSLEYRAYQTSAWAASALRESSLSRKYEGKSYLIWNGSWGDVDRNITTFVTKFHDQNGKQNHPETTPHNPWPN